MPAFIRKGGVHRQARFGMYAWFGSGGLKNGQEQILGLRMGHGAGGFALLAANATFRVYKDSFHPQFLSPSRMKGMEIEALFFRNTSSLETLSPYFLGKQIGKPGNRLSYYKKDSLAIQLTNVTFFSLCRSISPASPHLLAEKPDRKSQPHRSQAPLKKHSWYIWIENRTGWRREPPAFRTPQLISLRETF